MARGTRPSAVTSGTGPASMGGGWLGDRDDGGETHDGRDGKRAAAPSPHTGRSTGGPGLSGGEGA